MEIILASASPRRRRIFRQMGIEGKIIPAEVEELKLNDPVATCVKNAIRKVECVKDNRLPSEDIPILGFDTIVFKDGKILGKPENLEESRMMLEELSDRWHEVYTGVALLFGKNIHEDFDVTAVKFHRLTDTQINNYINTGETLDKAGSYGIQDTNMSFIEKIEGSFTNVIGFPLTVTRNLLGKIDFQP